MSVSHAIQDYAALGDGRSVALVDPDGGVVWWCVPNLDSPPLFDCLVNPQGAAAFTLRPAEPFQAKRRYREDSNVLETVFTTASGSARVTESLNSSLAGRLPWSELARRVEGLTGRVAFRARATFGSRDNTASPWLQPNPNGCVFHVGPVLGMLRYTSNVRLIEQDDRTIAGEVSLASGERAVFAMMAGEHEPLAVPPVDEVDARIDTSDDAWRSWAQGLHFEGPNGKAVRRSALVLKLLLYSASGAIAAAATTSLPERIGGPKNYDYRFAWVRDAAYTVNAFLRIGAVPESKAAFTWLMRRLHEHGPKVLYTLSGGLAAVPRELKEMAGWRDSRPVLVGNAAAAQHQHGIYGDIFETATLFVSGGHVLDQRSAAVLAGLADECADRWRLKDAGMWELEEPQHYTMSKISAWQALARASELAEAGHISSSCLPRWQRERDRVAAWVDQHCWSEARGAYMMYPGSDRLDAALVLAARFGFDGERMAATLDRIRAELGHGPFLYRFTGAEKEEGWFIACSFWLVEAYATLGRQAEAQRLFDDMLAALPAGLGIISEMVDPATGDCIGNTPQGLSHLALIHAACTLAGDNERPLAGGG